MITLTGHGMIALEMPGDHATDSIFRQQWKCQNGIEGQVETLVQVLAQGEVIAVSDSFFQMASGMAAWTIESQTSEHRLCGAGQTPGRAQDQSEYCSKLFSLRGVFSSLKQLAKKYQITLGRVVVACNSLSVLKKASTEWLPEPQEVHYNLISAIQNLHKQIPLVVTFQHVKGHQDCGQITALPCTAWMNIEMDALAKATVSLDGPMEQTVAMPYEGCVCSIEGHRIVKNLTATLWKHLNGPLIMNHWATKQNFHSGVAQDIDWEMAENAMLALPKHKQ